MLTKNRITITAMSTVNEVDIARFGVVLSEDGSDASFFNQQLDKAACKENREIVRADQATFEDLVYALQDSLNK